MSGWLRYFALKAQVRTGLSTPIAIWAVVAIIAAVLAAAFFLLAAFVFLAERYDALTAGLVLGGLFLVIAVIAVVVCLVVRRRNMERARVELVARENAARASLLDPKVLAMGLQVGQTIGWGKLVSLGAVALLAAGLAREWLGRNERPAVL